jgi:colicin import membrane protein
MIARKVAGAWTRPINATQGLRCTIQVKLLASGDVMDAVVIGSSGDPIFDRSAENAVRKASPLPVPQDRNLFNQEFRVFTFVFKPE